MKDIKLLIFDMDGTILNTIDDIADSLNYILSKHGFPTRTVDEVRFFVGNGLMKALARAVPEGTSEEVLEKIYPEFITYYRENAGIKTRPYDGIIEAISELRKRGFLTAVVSNKRDEAVKDLCDIFFKGCFDIAIGEQEGRAIKPAPDMVDYALSALGVERKNAIYIGDSDVDLMTAKNSCLPCIAVSWGFRGREFLEEHDADIIIDYPDEIIQIVSRE